jgi:hypothetical protein
VAKPYTPARGVAFNVTLRRAAIIIGVVLMGVCVIAGVVVEPPITTIVRLITGFYSVMMIMLGLAPSTLKEPVAKKEQA